MRACLALKSAGVGLRMVVDQFRGKYSGGLEVVSGWCTKNVSYSSKRYFVVRLVERCIYFVSGFEVVKIG